MTTTRTVTPIADVLLLEDAGTGELVIHGITERGRFFVVNFPHGIRTQELSIVVIQSDYIEIAFDLLFESGVVTRTL